MLLHLRQQLIFHVHIGSHLRLHQRRNQKLCSGYFRRCAVAVPSLVRGCFYPPSPHHRLVWGFSHSYSVAAVDTLLGCETSSFTPSVEETPAPHAQRWGVGRGGGLVCCSPLNHLMQNVQKQNSPPPPAPPKKKNHLDLHWHTCCGDAETQWVLRSDRRRWSGVSLSWRSFTPTAHQCSLYVKQVEPVCVCCGFNFTRSWRKQQ